MTLQELLANNMRSLIRDSKKIAKKSRVIKMSVKFEWSCTIFNVNFTTTSHSLITLATAKRETTIDTISVVL